jgi:cation diffusion facilitator family transporter
MSQTDSDHAGCPRSWLGEHHDRNERRTRWVVVLSCVMMVAEIVGGMYYGSMALVADGWHMATHAAALAVTMLAYRYARAHASDPRFAFGTGKVGDLAGFASAISLAIAGLLIGIESVQRLLHPRDIDFLQAGGIAVIGLLVNLVSAWLLRGEHHHEHDEGHDHEDHDHDHAHDHSHEHGHHDTNLRAAYLHVLADALTSVAAILGLLAGRLLGWVWMDAVVGILGAIVISHWAIGLARSAGRTLLDSHDDSALEKAVRERLRRAAGDQSLRDLHVWRVGPGRYAVMASLRGTNLAAPDHYRAQLADLPQLAHVTVEVNPA